MYREDLTVLEVTIETMEPTIYPFLFTTFCSYSIFLYQVSRKFLLSKQRKIPSKK